MLGVEREASYSNLPQKLEHLEMHHRGSRDKLVEALIQASSTSITHLRLGETGFQISNLINAVILAAPRLVELELITTIDCPPNYTVPLLQQLNHIRSLSIRLYGYDPSKLMQTLEQLRTLESFTLRLGWYLDRSLSSLHSIKAEKVTTYVSQATTLRSVTFPVEFRQVWSSAELAGVRQAALLSGVRLSFKEEGDYKQCAQLSV